MKFARTRHALLWIWHQALTLSLMVLVLVAVYVGLGRQLLPLVPDYKGQLEARLSADSGVLVRIQSLQGDLDGLTPEFSAKGIELRDPHRPDKVLLRIPGITTRPVLLASLLHREPRLITTLEGLNLHFVQQPDGRLEIAELSQLASSDPNAARQSVSLLLRQPSLVLKDGHIGLSLQGYPSVTLSGLALTSINEGNGHWLSGQFHLPSVRSSVRLIMQYKGDPLDWRQGNLQAYVSLPPVDITAWLQGLQIPHWAVKNAHGGGEYWFTFAQGALTDFRSAISIPQLLASRQTGDRTLRYEVHNLRGVLGWQRADDGWNFSADKLAGQVNGASLPAPRFAARLSGQHLDMATAQVAVAPLRSFLLTSGALPAAVQRWVETAEPSGWLPHLNFAATRAEDGSFNEPTVSAEFKALSFKASGHVPGASRMSGWLDVNSEGGLIYLDSQNAALDLRDHYREPLLATTLQGGIRVRHADGNWTLQSGPLHLTNADARGDALLTLVFPEKDLHASRMQLLAGIRDAKGASTYKYVPWSAAGDETVAWLKQAITGGTVETGQFLYDGPLFTRKDLPPHRMLMRFQMRDGRLAYLPGWPAVEGLAGEVVIDGSRLTVTSPTATVYSTRAENVVADIPDLEHAVLTVKGSLKGPGEDVTRLFRDTPLKDEVGRVGEVLSLSGEVTGQLALAVPLAGGPIKVKVDANLPDNTLRLPQQQLEVQHLSGPISFSTEQGLSSKQLTGRAFGQSVNAMVTTSMHGRDMNMVHVAVDGHVGVADLQQWTGSSLFKYLDGDSDYTADVYIPGDSRRTGQLILSSNLAGIRAMLPAPFGKGLEPLPFRYISDLSDGSNNARLILGKRLNAGLVWRDGKLDRALIRVGIDQPGWPDGPGIQLEARTPGRINVAEWQRWIAANATPGNDAAAELPSLTRLALDAKEIWAAGYVFRSAHVDARRDSDAWQVHVASERLDGRVKVPVAGKAHAPIEVALDRIRLPLVTEPDEEASKLESVPGLPGVPIMVQIKALHLDRWPNLPDSAAVARVLASPYGMRVDQMVISNTAMSFRGVLDWQWRGADETRLTGTLQSQDVSRILTGFGVAPTVTSNKAEASVNLRWDGGPEDLGTERLDGDLKVVLDDGRLLNVGVVTSASRIFGLLDLDNLKRRLHLDFSDVTRKGVGYDQMSLVTTINNGVMNPTRFELKGPSMSAEGQGKIDLNDGALDQDLKVTVPLSSAVPVAAAVVGGPLIGGAVVAAQRVLDKQLDKLTTIHYHIGGNWSEPQVERRQPTAAKDKAAAGAKNE